MEEKELDIRQFRYFITIAEEGQITAAARRLNMAQPPLSQALKAMEQELGVTLFERTKNALTLTHEGRLLLHKAIAVVNHFDETIAEIQEVGQTVGGTLSVGATIYCSPLMLDKIHLFREQNPLLKFRMWEGDSDRIHYLLMKRDIEIAIVHGPVQWPNVSALALGQDPFVIVMSKQWAHPSGDTVDLAAVADKPLILLKPPQGWSLYSNIIRELHRRIPQPNVLCECNDTVILLNLVSAGYGMTILPQAVLSLYPSDNFRILHVRDNPFWLQPRVVWRTSGYLSKAGQAFLRMFQE